MTRKMPEITLSDPQGTYLLWMDFRKYKLGENELENILINKAKIWMNKGSMFGVEGKGYYRMNIALPRSLLYKALEQLSSAFGAI